MIRARVARRRGARAPQALANIQYLETDDEKYSQVTVHGSTAYFAGQAELGDGIVEQTKNTLAECDRVLALAGTDKRNLLSVMVWLRDMNDYAAFNRTYAAWLDQSRKPVRACVRSEMALSEYLVEIQMTAAIPE